jgi:toxin-antitoxin system PIN domain toxin
MHLLDVNTWLALTFDSHVHHPSAKAWFDAQPSSAVCAFCRLTQMGFLRLATNPSVFGKDAVSMAEAWQKYAIFLSDPRVSYAEEPVMLEIQWRAFTQAFTQAQAFSPKVWNDAYSGCVRPGGWF